MEDSKENFDDKHLVVMEAILPYARKSPQKNLRDLVINNVTRKTSIRFFILPEWAVNFPPYNLARLVAVCKNAGYKATAVDLNVKSWRKSKDWGLDFDPWHGSQEWRWMGDSYFKSIHPHMIELIETQIDQLEEDKVDVVGFSLYYCNQDPTEYMAKRIKERLPHIKILVGGPQCHTFPPGRDKDFYDYIVSGEGEQIILKILEQIEDGNGNVTQQTIVQPPGMRLNLDTMPMPDYSEFDISEYKMPNGVNSEFSRGCVAKCVFCSETHFWKYRGRSSSSLLNEILTLNENYGTDFVWFLDSLVNGNINELRAFCKGIIASGIKLGWTGYARCHKAMDLEYFEDLAASGCKHLNFGIESGSEKVLKDMDKKVDRATIESNLLYSHKVGIKSMTNWIIGFPTETTQDYYESMTLVARNAEYVYNVPTGHGFTEPPDTIVSQNSDQYRMLRSYYLDNWILEDFTSSKLHRMLRIMYFNIFLSVCRESSPLHNFEVDKFSNLKISNNMYRKVDYETYDFKIIKDGPTDFANTLMNEIWPLCRLLYRVRGSYSLTIDIDPQKSYNIFGGRLSDNLVVKGKIKCDNNGKFRASLIFDYKQPDDAWRYVDYRFEDSIAAQAARQQSIPGNKGEIIMTTEKKHKLLKDLDEHKKLDFSFTHKAKVSGTW